LWRSGEKPPISERRGILIRRKGALEAAYGCSVMALSSDNSHDGSIDYFSNRERMNIAGAHAGALPYRLVQAWEPHRPVSGEGMNKADLVDRIAGACSVSKAQATTAIDTAVDSITAALKKGDRVALIGFGTFSVSQRKARNGRNPQTGATIKIAARRVAKFTPGNELRKVVNKGK
jgi:DNA-binding protein HU-beta